MRKVIDSWRVECLLLFRSRWTWLFLLGSLILVYIQFQSRLELDSPGDSLTSTAFIIQGGLFVSMILGLTLVRRERMSFSDEMFDVISYGSAVKMVGKALLLLTVVLLFTLLSLLLLYIMYLSYDVPAVFYQQAILYLFLYWSIPFMISGILGMIVGIWTRTRWDLVWLVVLWIFLGPLNYDIFKQFFYLFPQTDPTSVLNFLNLGQTDPYTPYNPVYGFPMEVKRWLQKGMFLLTIGSVWGLSLIIKSSQQVLKGFIWITSVYLLLMIPMNISFFMNDQVIATGSRSNSMIIYDQEYYRVHPQPQIENHTPFLISKYDIRVHAYRNLAVDLDLQLTPQANGQKLVFTLYHDLKVKQVRMDQKNLSFQQKGDQVAVEFPKLLTKDQPISLSFEYEGTSSPYFFANEQAVMLPNYFAWLPAAGSYQVMNFDPKMNLLTRQYIQLQHDIEYELTYEGPNPLFVNLPQKGAAKWQGKVKNGLILAGGEYLTSRSIEGIQVVYPQSLYHLSSKLDQLIKNMKELDQSLSSDLSAPQHKNIKTLFLLSIPPEENDSFTLWGFDDQMILGVDQGLNELSDELVNPATLKRLLLYSHMKKNNPLNKQQEMKTFFFDSYLYWDLLRSGHQSNEESAIIKVKIDSFHEFIKTSKEQLQVDQRNQEEIKMRIQETEVMLQRYTKMAQYIEQTQSDEAELKHFFQQYFQLFNRSDEVKWEEIQSLMK